MAASNGRWTRDDTELELRVDEPLPAHSLITATLRGFRTRTNRLVLEQVELVFETGEDDDPPGLASSAPRDGETDVDPTTLDQMLLFFDEEMDASIGNVPVQIGEDSPRSVPGRWDDRARTFTVDSRVLDLPFYTDVLVDLTVFADAVGNQFPDDGAGGDGALAFGVGPNTMAPFVQSSVPLEGSMGVATDLEAIEVIFSEEMDPTIVDFTLVGDNDTSLNLSGVYEERGLVLRLDLPEPLAVGVGYELDLRSVRDRGGQALPEDESFTEDGILNFRTSPPSGDTCDDAFELQHGTTTDERTTIVIDSAETAVRPVESADGGAQSCTLGAPAPDAVFTYEKTTPSFSDGGALLYVSAEIEPDNPTMTGIIGYELVRDVCAPDSHRFGERQLGCFYGARRYAQYLDVGPGSYHLFVASTFSTVPFPGATITVEELGDPALFEGESCAAPFDEESAAHTSLGPGRHRWRISGDDIDGLDMARSWGGGGAMSCARDFRFGTRPGPDAVIRIDKADASSLLRVALDGSSETRFEVFEGGCEGESDESRSVFCGSGTTDARPFEGLIGYSGPVHVWIASRTVDQPLADVTLEVEEITPIGLGEACGRGLPLMSGRNDVTATGTARLQAPACLGDPSDDIVWYEYVLSADAVVFDVEGTDDVVLRAPDGDELWCDPPGPVGLPGIFDAGQTVCVGVAGGGGTSAITVTDIDYTGPSANGRTVLPVVVDGVPPTTSPSWLAAGLGRVFIGRAVGVVDEVDLLTGISTLHGSADGLDMETSGQGGVVASGSLFGLGFVTGRGEHRVHRLWNGKGSDWSAMAWEGPDPDYPFGFPNGIASDGQDIFVLTSAFPRRVAIIPNEGGTMELSEELPEVGTANAIDADSSDVFLLDRTPGGDPDTLFRIPKGRLYDPAAGAAEQLPISGLVPLIDQEVVVDGESSPSRYLFIRLLVPGGVHVIDLQHPAGPRFLGRLVETHVSDAGIAYDHEEERLVVYDSSVGGTAAPRVLLLE